MLTVDDYGRIRRAHRDGMSIREIARRFHHSRYKVREILRGDQAEPEPYAPRRAFEDERARSCSAKDVLDYLIERAGLIREPSPGWVDFQHRTFQEYMAACAAGALHDAGDLAQRAGEDQWHETIIMSAGTKVGGVPFGNSLLEELLRKGENSRGTGEDGEERIRYTCYVLAVACLETALQVKDDIRSRILTHLNEIVPPRNDTQARWLSAAGDAVLPLLEYSRWQAAGADIVEACTRTIALVGSEAAAKMLEQEEGYGGDPRDGVLSAVCACDRVNVLRLPRIREILQSRHQQFPQNVRERIRSIDDIAPLVSLREEIRSLCIFGWSGVDDWAPLGELSELEELRIGGTRGAKGLRALSQLSKLKCLDYDAWSLGTTSEQSGST